MNPTTLQLVSGCLLLICACPFTQGGGAGRVLKGPNRGAIDTLKDLYGIDTIKTWKEFPLLKFLEEAYLLYYSHSQRFPLSGHAQSQIANHMERANTDPSGTKYIPRVNNRLKTTMVIGDSGVNTAIAIGAAFFRWIQGEQIAIWLNRESTDEEIKVELINNWEAGIEKIKRIELSKRTEEEKRKLNEPVPIFNDADVKAEKEKRAKLFENARNAYEPLLKIMESRGVPVFRRTGTTTDKGIHGDDVDFINHCRGAGIESVFEGQSSAGQDGSPLYPKVYRSSAVLTYLRKTEEAVIWAADVTSFLKTLLYDTSNVQSSSLQNKLNTDKSYVIIADYTTAINGFFPEQESELLNKVEPVYYLGVPSMIQDLIETGKPGFEGLPVFKRKHTTFVVTPRRELLALLKATPHPFFSEANFEKIKELHTGYFDIAVHHISSRM